ncbi:hypothetical protein TTHERM_00274480 (macronuclear) [Tetrahymena thermophila SB210]|uniref:H-type lectin domain-containing protein n=1 Tax=Tetrahymena thermophila (strain SB210) TaxID=312017 RepID=I7LUR3_TETTS|nr:hypothetical protein TTHERM_00274480 [Tetrahymena thermophila SB210]EAR95743.2 hypothetical protein TTHERM_00274480 [Tetrahymena thermophila SB210]|eukprot:XP_001015988.2 hypothetical protein TTHERM_00274480 [Tetrahymena thermophila SB210]
MNNNFKVSRFIKFFLVIFTYQVNNICAQIQYDDQVPFIYYQQSIKLRFYKEDNPQFQVIDFSSKQFKKPPLVIVGVGFYNNKWDPDKQILFELVASSITNTQCNITLISDQSTSYLTGIKVNILAIDTSQFPFVNVINQNQQNINFDNYQFQEKRSYSSTLQGTKNVMVVVRGWKSSAKDSTMNSFSLTVFATNVDNQNYIITITTSQLSLTIFDVYYTIIEYVVNPPSQYGIISNYDNKYQNPTNEACFSSQNCTNYKRYFPVYFKIVKIQITQQQNYSNFYTSINQYQFSTFKFEQDPRLELTNYTLNSDTITYSYHTWDSSICTGSTSSFLFFYRKVCQNNQDIDITGNICINKCNIKNPLNDQQCLDCSSGQYFLQDKQLCQTEIPVGYECTQIDQFYKCQNCKIDNCQICKEGNPSQFNCTQCINTFYLFNNQCFSKQPDNTICNDNLICQDCSEKTCLTCILSQEQNLQCQTCYDQQIPYQGKCYKKDNPPNNTYCDWSKLICLPCTDLSCKICSNPNSIPQQCLSCQDNQFLYDGKCYSQNNPPNNTYCDQATLKCQKCNDINCATCSDPSKSPQQCLSCSNNQIIFNGQCYTKENPPNNTYCDWINLKCQPCNDINCATCSDPSKGLQKCLSCVNKSILFNGQCYTKDNPPNNTYCDWVSLKCQLCNDINCLTCSDPNQQNQYCLSCQKELQYLFNGKCYCGNGKFGIGCKQNCIQSCILCQDQSSCDKYSQERIYQKEDCHFSCSKCYIPHKDYACQECSSDTRQIQQLTSSCSCKEGYIESGVAECKIEQTLQPNNNFQSSIKARQ